MLTFGEVSGAFRRLDPQPLQSSNTLTPRYWQTFSGGGSASESNIRFVSLRGLPRTHRLRSRLLQGTGWRDLLHPRATHASAAGFTSTTERAGAAIGEGLSISALSLGSAID